MDDNTYFVSSELNPQPVSNLTKKQFDVLINDVSKALDILRSQNIVHNNITESYIVKASGSGAPNTYALTWNHLLMSYSTLNETKMYSESTYLAPVQIIIEMLSSAKESSLIEKKHFKTKMMEFWLHLLKKQTGNTDVQYLALTYFLAGSGCMDFCDFFINRYCMINGDYVIKDPKKALGYLSDIDQFAFGISIHYLAIANKIPITPKLKTTICNFIKGLTC